MLAKLSTCVVVVVLAVAPATARLSNFAGHWANSNADGRLRSLSVRIEGTRVTVRAYARCESSYCNWDAVEGLPYTANPSSNPGEDTQAIFVTFKRPDSDIVLILSLPNGTSPLRVEEFTHFTDDSGRTSFTTASNFGRAATAAARPHSAEDGVPTNPAGDTIPQFPWPPPQASATDIVPRSFLLSAQTGSLKDVDQRLVAALDACGYVGKSYYAVPDGFALVTQLEQINPDGTPRPSPGRWAAKIQPLSSFSLSDYLKALFTANPGRYRIIVFVVTSHPFSQAEAKISKEEALGWLSKGLNQLPASIGTLPFTGDYAATALIYEFEEAHAGENPVFITPSGLTGRDHLTKSKLWPALEK